MPTSTAITASSGTRRVMRVEDDRRRQPAAVVVAQCAGPSRRASVAQRRAISGRRSSGGRPPSSAASSRSAVTAMSPCTGTSTGWKRPSAMGSRSTCTIGSFGGDAGVVGERGAHHQEQVGLVHEPARDGRAAASQHAAAERVVVGDQSLALEGGQHRRVEPLGQRAGPRPSATRAPWPTITAGRRAARSRSVARASASAGGAMPGSPTRPAGPGRAAPSRAPGASARRRGRSGATTSRPTIACFRARAISSAWRLSGCTVWPQPGHAAVGLRAGRSPGRRPGRAPGGLHLAGQGEDRGPVDLRVPEAGEEVGGPRPGDREARRGAAGELGEAPRPRSSPRPRGGCRRR